MLQLLCFDLWRLLLLNNLFNNLLIPSARETNIYYIFVTVANKAEEYFCIPCRMDGLI